MAMCTLGGIGRVAALGQWAQPLSIIGILLGVAILVLGLMVIFGVRLPILQTETQAVLLIAALTAAKIVLSVIHSRLG